MIEKEDAVIIPVDPAIFMNYTELQRIRSEVVNPLVDCLSLKPFFSLHCGEPYGFEIHKAPTELFQRPANKSTRAEIDTCQGNLEPISLSTDSQDVEKLRHINRLKVAFNNISQEEISESVKFLIEKCEWTNADFQNTMPKPISPITIYRYKNGCEKALFFFLCSPDNL